MLTLNQIMAELAVALEQHEVAVNQYLGDGFMALVRGADRAQRAVVAALDLVQVLKAFNRPRQVLEVPLLRARIGISTGGIVFGKEDNPPQVRLKGLGTQHVWDVVGCKAPS